jgi:hypothetical protein
MKGKKDLKTMEKEAIYINALSEWGIEAQITMIFEEMAELQKELCKFLRDDIESHKKYVVRVASIAEELADCEIMLEQMKILFQCEEGVKFHKIEKLRRLKKRLNI